MPLYEYDCPGCGRTFEKLVRSTAAQDGVVCPHCGGQHARKKLSTFAVGGRSTGGSAASISSAASCAPSGG